MQCSCCTSKEERQAGLAAEARIGVGAVRALGLPDDDSTVEESTTEEVEECAAEELTQEPRWEGQVDSPPDLEAPAAESMKKPDSSGKVDAAIQPSRSTLCVSELLNIDDQQNLRATSLNRVLHNRALILEDSTGTEATYLLSKNTPVIDVFISHNWSVSRQKKFWALTLHFNVVYAMAGACVGVALGCMLNKLGLPPTLLHGGDSVTRPYCYFLGSCCFFLTLLLGHDVPLLGRLLCQQRLFLDKVCINQTDPAKKAAGIRNLGAFLRHSRTMIVLFNAIYIQKLWTVYELACFMYLHHKRNLSLVPVEIAGIALQSTAAVVVVDGISVVAVHFGSGLGIGSLVRAVNVALLGSVLVIILAYILRRWALRRSELFSKLRSFQLLEARCTDEGDRPVVNSNICSFVRAMGLAPEDSSEADALQTFDKFVQEKMPDILRSTVGRTGLPYRYACVAGMSITFSIVDIISSKQDASMTYVAAYLILAFNLQAVTIPSVFLVCGWAGSRCPRLGRWGELARLLGTTVLAITVLMATYLFAAFLRNKALVTAWWLLPFGVLSAAESCAVAKLF